MSTDLMAQSLSHLTRRCDSEYADSNKISLLLLWVYYDMVIKIVQLGGDQQWLVDAVHEESMIV